MFTGIIRMRPQCDVCHLKFEREEGYWTGAMLINWVMVCVVLCPVWVVMLLRGVSFIATLLATFLLLVALIPWLFRYSRVIWLHLDHSVDTGE
jgi:hypothetical protein